MVLKLEDTTEDLGGLIKRQPEPNSQSSTSYGVEPKNLLFKQIPGDADAAHL